MEVFNLVLFKWHRMLILNISIFRWVKNLRLFRPLSDIVFEFDIMGVGKELYW